MKIRQIGTDLFLADNAGRCRPKDLYAENQKGG